MQANPTRTNRKKWFIIILLVAIASIATYYILQEPDEREKTIVVGYLPIYVDLPLFVAKEKGFFEKRGIKVELKRFESSPDVGTALVNNNVDAVASIATTVVLNIESRDSGKIKIFMLDAATKENYLSSFVALKNSGINSIQDLKGKKIGSFPGPTAVRFGKMVLETFGIDPSTDVEWVELPVNTHLSVLEAKTVDALFTYEPTATQAVMEKNAVKILPAAIESQIINPWHAGSWVISDEFLRDNPELGEQFIQAIYDAVDYMATTKEQYKDALLPYTKVKIEVANSTPNIGFSKIGAIDLTTFQKYLDLHTEKGLISKKINATGLLLTKYPTANQ